jgi:hypothetical protein
MEQEKTIHISSVLDAREFLFALPVGVHRFQVEGKEIFDHVFDDLHKASDCWAWRLPVTPNEARQKIVTIEVSKKFEPRFNLAGRLNRPALNYAIREVIRTGEPISFRLPEFVNASTIRVYASGQGVSIKLAANNICTISTRIEDVSKSSKAEELRNMIRDVAKGKTVHFDFPSDQYNYIRVHVSRLAKEIGVQVSLHCDTNEKDGKMNGILKPRLQTRDRWVWKVLSEARKNPEQGRILLEELTALLDRVD